MSQSVLEQVGEQIDKTAHDASRAASYVADALEDGVKAARRAAVARRHKKARTKTSS